MLVGRQAGPSAVAATAPGGMWLGHREPREPTQPLCMVHRETKKPENKERRDFTQEKAWEAPEPLEMASCRYQHLLPANGRPPTPGTPLELRQDLPLIHPDLPSAHTIPEHHPSGASPFLHHHHPWDFISAAKAMGTTTPWRGEKNEPASPHSGGSIFHHLTKQRRAQQVERAAWAVRAQIPGSPLGAAAGHLQQLLTGGQALV